MANNTPKKNKAHQPLKHRKRSFGSWFVRNGVLLLTGYLFLTKAPFINPVYVWLRDNYLKSNMEIIKQYPDATYDQKMALKLGGDYNYILFLRDNTPEDAVIYYPSGGDFRATHPAIEQNPFNGKLIDKLTVVRALYPRKVITEEEYGKTSWSKKITHVAIVNGKNRDKLPYPVGENYVNGVLPVKQPVQQTNTPKP